MLTIRAPRIAPPETAYAKTGHDPGGQGEGDAVDHQQEEAQGQNRDRQRQQRQDRPHDRVDDTQYQRCHSKCRPGFDVHAGQEVGGCEEGEGDNENVYDESAHAPILSKPGDTILI